MTCKLLDYISLGHIAGIIKELKLLKDKPVTKLAEQLEMAIENGDDLFDEDIDILLDGVIIQRDDIFLEDEPEKKKELRRLEDILTKKQY